jgi:integrase
MIPLPMNQELTEILSMHAAWFTKRFKDTSGAEYLFPRGSPFPTDPTRPTTTIKTAWESLRETASVSCRLHDLRHTAATKNGRGGQWMPGSLQPQWSVLGFMVELKK